MKYVFVCYGHNNIQAKHYRTIEFTKDTEVSLRGDCIIGVRATFDASELKKLSGKIRIIVEVNGLRDTFKATINPWFDDDREIVFRKSRYMSQRTLGCNLNKGSNRLDRRIVRIMQDPHTVMQVTIEETKKPKKGVT